MAQKLKATFFGMALACAGAASAWASNAGPGMNEVVNDCVFLAGVTGQYQLTPATYGEVPAYSVPASASVTQKQSRHINRCIRRAVRARTQIQQRGRPTSTAQCKAEYHAKLRTSGGGRTYRGNRAGTRVLAGMFGSDMGRRLIEFEYDRCLDTVADDNERCPTGTFTGGSGYCIRRPVW